MESIHQQNQTQINEDNICENIKHVDYDYKVVDKVILNNNATYKYEAPYKGPFAITQFWINVMVTI